MAKLSFKESIKPDVLRLYNEGNNRAQIGRILEIRPDEVSDILEEMGVAKCVLSDPWTQAEIDLIHQIAPDLTLRPRHVADRFPGRKLSAVSAKLNTVRVSMGLSFKSRRVPAKTDEPLVEERQRDESLIPGTYRDRHGVTLPYVSCLFEEGPRA